MHIGYTVASKYTSNKYTSKTACETHTCNVIQSWVESAQPSRPEDMQLLIRNLNKETNLW